MFPNNFKKILEFLLRNSPDAFNVNQIAKLLSISVGSVHKIARSLLSKEILITEKIGNAIYFRINFNNNETKNILCLILIESRRVSLAKNPAASVYAKDINPSSEISAAAIVFGSILEKKNAKDVDVLFIIEKENTKKIRDFCLNLSSLRPKKISPLLMTATDFGKNLKKRDKVLKNILQNGVIVFGEDRIIDIMKEAL